MPFDFRIILSQKRSVVNYGRKQIDKFKLFSLLKYFRPIDFALKILYNVSMKKYRFNYSPSIFALIALVVLISGAGVALNVMTVAKYVDSNTLNAVLYGILTVLTAVLFAEAVAIAVYGIYKIHGDYLYSYFGLVRTKVLIADITEVKIFSKTNKLVLYFNTGKYTVIIISPEKYSDFISDLLKINPQIYYSAEDSITS